MAHFPYNYNIYLISLFVNTFFYFFCKRKTLDLIAVFWLTMRPLWGIMELITGCGSSGESNENREVKWLILRRSSVADRRFLG